MYVGNGRKTQVYPFVYQPMRRHMVNHLIYAMFEGTVTSRLEHRNNRNLMICEYLASGYDHDPIEMAEIDLGHVQGTLYADQVENAMLEGLFTIHFKKNYPLSNISRDSFRTPTREAIETVVRRWQNDLGVNVGQAIISLQNQVDQNRHNKPEIFWS